MRNKGKAASDCPRYDLLLVSLQIGEAKGNPVMRVGAFSEGQSEKAALGQSYRRRVAVRLPDKAEIPKAPDPRINGLISWEFDPLPLTPVWMAKGYLHLTSRTIATTASYGGDPGWPPSKGSAGKRDRECQRDSRNHTQWCDPTRVTVYGVMKMSNFPTPNLPSRGIA